MDESVGLSFLVPYRADSDVRAINWGWLRKYWQAQFPNAEIIIGESDQWPFSKTQAVNNAASRATGDVYAILDADCYINPSQPVSDSVSRIRQARDQGRNLWFIPYRRFFRLTRGATGFVLQSYPDGNNPLQFSDPPPPQYVEDTDGSTFGHWWGALIQVMPREAFWAVGGMDERFAGWGGEDVSFMRTLDTMWGKHRTTDNSVLHLWHPKIGVRWGTRRWDGQMDPHSNDQLAWRYQAAYGDLGRMRRLISEPGYRRE